MKSFLFLPLMLLAITFTSCKKEEIIQEVVPNRTITTTVQPGDWKQDTDKGSYYVTINMPEIDSRVYETNGVLTYFSFDGKIYETIPDVFEGATLQVTYSVGSLSIDIQGADGGLVNPPGEPIFVKIVLVESDPV
jgi:hypothetical protein